MVCYGGGDGGARAGGSGGEQIESRRADEGKRSVLRCPARPRTTGIMTNDDCISWGWSLQTTWSILQSFSKASWRLAMMFTAAASKESFWTKVRGWLLKKDAFDYIEVIHILSFSCARLWCEPIYAMVVAKSAIYFHAFEVAKACCILPQWRKTFCPSWPSPLSKNQQAPVCSTATPPEPYITSLVSSNLSHHIRDRRHLILRIKLVAVHVAFFSCIDRSSTAFPDFARQTDKSAEQPTKSFSCLMSRFTWFRPGVGSCFTVYL